MVYIIANKLSGGGKGAACLQKTEEILKEQNVEFTTLVSEYAGHSTVLSKQACADLNCRRIIAIGGDGTFNEVVSGMDLSVPVAFVPAGTGNDFVSGAALPKDTTEAVLSAVNGKVKLYDMLSVNGRRCLNVAGTGFDVNVLLQEEKIRKIYKGSASYTLALARSLLKLEFTPVTLTTDTGETVDEEIFLLAAANGRFYGGGLPICPAATATDGYMDLVVIKKLTYAALPGVLLKFFKGKIAEIKKYAKIIHCKKCTLTVGKDLPVNIDGELMKETQPVQIEVLPKRLQVLVK